MEFNFKLENINYVKIICTDSMGNERNFKASVKRIDNREVLTCIKNEESLNIPCPQKTEIGIACSDGMYKAETVLKSVDVEAPYIFFIFEKPVDIEYQQKREYFRVSAKYNCTLYVENEGESILYQGKTVDISANGVSVWFPIAPITGDNHKLEIDINNRIISTDADFIRKEDTETGYKVSFFYKNISESDSNYISQVCIQTQIEQRRNSLL